MKTWTVFLILAVSIAVGQTSDGDIRMVGDWRKLLNEPFTESEQFYRELAAKVRQSKVPNEEEAKAIAIRAGIDFDARAGWRVTALLRLGVMDKELGQKGDFVWEVRLVRLDGDISGLIWVSTVTGSAKVLFSPSSK